MELPIISEAYHHFDDGKINMRRRMVVIIEEIIPYDDIDAHTKSLWLDEVNHCGFLYNKETDFFIKGNLYISKDLNESIVYVRSKHGWFSIGYWSGRLDISGELNNSLIREIING